GRPTAGAWLAYGLGTETDQLPAFVVITSVSKVTTCGQIVLDCYWGSGCLPSRLQGVKFRVPGDPVLYLSNPEGMSRAMRRGVLDHRARLNELKLRDFGDHESATRAAQYERRAKGQASHRGRTVLSNEPESVL